MNDLAAGAAAPVNDLAAGAAAPVNDLAASATDSVSAALRTERAVVRHPGAEFDAVRDLTLHVEPGEILVLVGPNGCGKSTLLAALGWELALRDGTRCLELDPDAERSSRARARVLARLPQDPVGSEGLRVRELVETGRYAHTGPFAGLTARDDDAVRRALEAVDLVDEAKRPLETLSGGQRRRAWIGLVLAQQAPILLLDEPTASLDLRHQIELLDTLRTLNRERELSIVISLHDLEQAAALADRIAVLHRGRLYRVGAPLDVLDKETLCDVFGVDAEITRADDGLRIRVLGPADPLRSL